MPGDITPLHALDTVHHAGNTIASEMIALTCALIALTDKNNAFRIEKHVLIQMLSAFVTGWESR
jgi:hypothetical protein